MGRGDGLEARAANARGQRQKRVTGTRERARTRARIGLQKGFQRREAHTLRASTSAQKGGQLTAFHGGGGDGGDGGEGGGEGGLEPEAHPRQRGKGPRPHFSLDDVLAVQELDEWEPPHPPPRRDLEKEEL